MNPAAWRPGLWLALAGQRTVMDQAISAAEANRSFSRLLREVREGRSYVVTAHGKPVARIVPCNDVDSARIAARAALLQRLGIKPWPTSVAGRAMSFMSADRCGSPWTRTFSPMLKG